MRGIAPARGRVGGRAERIGAVAARRAAALAAVVLVLATACTPREILRDDMAVLPADAQAVLGAELDEQWEPYTAVEGPRVFVLGDSQVHEGGAKPEIYAALTARGWSASVAGLSGTSPETAIVASGTRFYDAFLLADHQRGAADVLVLSTGMNGILREQLRPGWDAGDEEAIRRFVDLGLTTHPCVALVEVTVGRQRPDLVADVDRANAFLAGLAAADDRVHLVDDHSARLAYEPNAFDRLVDGDRDGTPDGVAWGGDGIHLGDAPTASQGMTGQELYAEHLADVLDSMTDCRRTGPAAA